MIKEEEGILLKGDGHLKEGMIEKIIAGMTITIEKE
jgi:hypothetical protein